MTFHNEYFKRGRPDLLQKIQRSTRGGADKASLADQAREVDSLNAKVFILEEKVRDLEATLERNILGKVEAMVMNMMGSTGYPGVRMPAQNLFMNERSFGSMGFLADPLLGAQAARAFSTASASSMGGVAGADGQPTLPPHPKQKLLPPPSLGTITAHSASGGLRNISGGHLTNSSLLLRNAWEDKFLSSVMMTEGASRAASLAGIVGGGLGGLGGGGLGGHGNVGGLAAFAAAQQMQHQQMGYAAMLQKNAQQGAASAVGIGGEASDGDVSEDLQRQTTAEILLEAAGELGTNANLPPPDKTRGLRRESTGARFLAAALDVDEPKRAAV